MVAALLALTNLEAGRIQMAVSLGFHIVFAALGIGMPVMMLFAKYRAIRTGDPEWRARPAVGEVGGRPGRRRGRQRHRAVVLARPVLARADGPMGLA